MTRVQSHNKTASPPPSPNTIRNVRIGTAIISAAGYYYIEFNSSKTKSLYVATSVALLAYPQILITIGNIISDFFSGSSSSGSSSTRGGAIIRRGRYYYHSPPPERRKKVTVEIVQDQTSPTAPVPGKTYTPAPSVPAYNPTTTQSRPTGVYGQKRTSSTPAYTPAPSVPVYKQTLPQSSSGGVFGKKR